jgi:hypothetical protein
MGDEADRIIEDGEVGMWVDQDGQQEDRTPTLSLKNARRAWFLEGHDDGTEWVRRWFFKTDELPDIEDFHEECRSRELGSDPHDNPHSRIYRDGFDAGYGDACDSLDTGQDTE